MEPTPLLILYGSETGQAQDVAERVGREAARRHFAPQVLPADAFLPRVAELPALPALVVVTSTAGQGELPRGARGLWRFLRRRALPPGSLAGVRAAVFGLGDSGYPKFNVAAKLFYRRLEALGADVGAAPLGLGDDQHPAGYEAALDAWLPALWRGLRARFPLPPGAAEPAPEDASAPPEARFAVEFLGGPPPGAAARAGAQTQHEEAVAAAAAFARVEAAAAGTPPPGGDAAGADARELGGWGPARPYFARVAAARRVTAAAHFQDVRLIELDLAVAGMEYRPGDVIALWPRQGAAAVDALLSRCGLDPGAWVRVRPARAGPGGGPNDAEAAAAPVEAVARVRALVAGAVDAAGAPPRRSFFEALARAAAPGSAEAERLEYLASPEGRDDLHAYCGAERRGAGEVLADFGGVPPPAGGGWLPWLLQFAPRLQPRRFSAASAPAAHPGAAHLLVAVVSWVTPARRRRRGVATAWLASLDAADPGCDSVPCWAERGALRPPADPGVPMLMVGPGTGVAPFRAFMQARAAAATAAAAAGAPPPAPCLLFFGCRHEAGDYYFRDEWEALRARGLLGALHAAFSRDGAAKRYVQHDIADAAAEVWGALQAGACVYVAGSADRMPADVAAAVAGAAAAAGGLAPDEAAAYVRGLEACGRWQVEAW